MDLDGIIKNTVSIMFNRASADQMNAILNELATSSAGQTILQAFSHRFAVEWPF